MNNIRQVMLTELRQHLTETHQTRRIDKVILHHTWKPTAAQYRGVATWEGIKRYHMRERGWQDIGYHIGIAPNGSIWLLRPLPLSGAHCLGYNQHSVGVVMIGNFDEEEPFSNGLRTAAKAIGAIGHAYGLYSDDVYFHRDFSNKTCPGTRIDRAGFRSLVSGAMAEQAQGHEWSEQARIWAEEEGLITGKRWSDPVTREELAVILLRYNNDIVNSSVRYLTRGRCNRWNY